MFREKLLTGCCRYLFWVTLALPPSVTKEMFLVLSKTVQKIELKDACPQNIAITK